MIHELATNSVKRDALSCDEGVLQVDSTVDDDTMVFLGQKPAVSLAKPYQASRASEA